jgi:hypothetical protein
MAVMAAAFTYVVRDSAERQAFTPAFGVPGGGSATLGGGARRSGGMPALNPEAFKAMVAKLLHPAREAVHAAATAAADVLSPTSGASCLEESATRFTMA